MILDQIKNTSLYSKYSSRIEKALQFIKSTDFSKYEKGKHDIDGDKLFFIVNEYETKLIQDNILEAHKKYIDLQFMINGSEIINYETFNNHIVNKKYDADNDYCFYDARKSTQLKLEKGMFAMFFPDDLHLPGYANGNVEQIKKIVVKIKIDE